MSFKANPAIVLVHGAWHVPSHYSDFIEQLQKAGFEVFCPLLPTCDEAKRLTANLSTDAESIRSQIMSLVDSSREVVMLLHSYGGVVGTEAVKGLSAPERATEGLPGGVVRLIYMCAFMLQVGESALSASFDRPGPEPVEVDTATGTTFLCEPPRTLFYGDLEPEKAKEMESLLVRHSGVALTDTQTYPAWQHIPTTYLRALDDGVLVLKWQDTQIKAVRDAGVEVSVETFKSSHSPYISMTGEVVSAVERAIHGK
ncbi:hypothetical protein MMC20_000425 [Loxospora ochrophaea]|nr:hypothetical protein [Loxospora ochrophaea]